MKIAIINGPNLNMLGIREPDIYGSNSYDDLCSNICSYARKKEIEIIFFQSNGEKEIIDFIQDIYSSVDGIIINPAAFTHYSYALHDAIKSVPTPFIEVHISNIHAREGFRNTSVTASACIGSISGFGEDSYIVALDAIYRHISNNI
ncbi:type II 3-dehydroquinate dehydratase [Peptostreptococcus faecalis]|uniref:type II 3-dehydroquinate dehydratase n=1 Tax=Peptostreptococcus faecalis TaxID=2045015 RepID=UPI000C79B72B|nr:type II 3-dehydroquinate dehydratase [Peptostreptococcus faecalis]